jgi:MATE family multidrug resistance protein
MVFARTSQAMLGFFDALQTSHLGASALVAASTGAANTACLVMLPLGAASITSSMVAQLHGRGAHDAKASYAWYGLIIALLAGVLGVIAGPLVTHVIGLFPFAPDVQQQMATYMAIRLCSVAAMVGSEVLGGYFSAQGKPWIQMASGILVLAINAPLNYWLINGGWGVPALGVAGSALASAIASTLAFLFVFVMFLRTRQRQPRALLQMTEFVRVVRVGIPVGLHWFSEFASWQLFANVVLGDLGTVPLAAFNAVMTISTVACMPTFAIAAAGSVLAGQWIGKGRRDLVWPQLRQTLLVSLVWMAAVGLLYLLIPALLLGIFAHNSDAAAMLSIGGAMLMLTAGWQIVDAAGACIGETLRSAGDTRWCAVAHGVLSWGVFLPVAFLVVRQGGGVAGALWCLAGYFAALAALFAYRFATGAWRSIELLPTSG